MSDHLRSMWRQDGWAPEKMPAQLEPVECDEAIKYLWAYFCRLSARRQNNGMGLSPISHSDFAAWEQREGIKLLPFEVDALNALERAFLEANQPKK